MERRTEQDLLEQSGAKQSRIEGYCTLCKSHCGSVSVVEGDRLVAVEPLPDHPTGGALCAKGRAMPELVASPKRLLRPMRRTNPKDADDPGWVPISWDEALGEVAERLAAIRAESGAESVAFAVTTTSGTPMVDGHDWVVHFIRHFGSPNIVYATEICGWHKNFAHAFTYGRGIGIPDYRGAELIVLWGHNPARTWLSQATAVAEARRDGAKVVVIDPKRAGSGQQADQWLRIRPGTDGALAIGAIRHLITTGSYDSDFVRSWTNAPMLIDVDSGEFVRDGDSFLVWDAAAGAPRSYDVRHQLADPENVALRGEFRFADGRTVRPAFDLLADHVDEWTIEKVAETTWMGAEEISDFYQSLARWRRVAYYCWTGVGQHTNATQTERALGVLYALTGRYDQPGGLRWVDKHPTNPLGSFSILTAEQRAKTLGLRDKPLGPPAQGNVTARDFRRAALTGDPYRVRAMVGFGANMVVSQGDADENRKALRALEFQVQCDIFENPTAHTADILLPVCAPPEREGLLVGFDSSVEGEKHVQLRPRMVAPAGESRSDYDIVFALARRLGMSDAFFGGDLDAGWNHHLEPLGITVDELRRRPAGMRIEKTQEDRKYAAESADGTVAGFDTATRRVELYSALLRAHDQPALPTFTEPDDVPPGDPAFPYVLTTAKNGHFTHSSLRSLASLRRRSPDPSVDINPALAAETGLTEGDWALIRTPDGQARLRVRFDRDIHPKVVIAEPGWWDTDAPMASPGLAALGRRTSNINAALADRRHDPVSGSVPLRAVACSIGRDEEFSRGNWAGWRTFRVAAREHVDDSAVALTLRPVDGGAVPEFRPGQHVDVRAPRIGTQRAYSLTNAGLTATPTDGMLRIAVKNIGGQMSGHLHAEADLDHLDLRAPAGTFTLPVGGRRPVLAIGGGIGVTPFLGYLETLAAGAPAPPQVMVIHTHRESEPPAGTISLTTRLRAVAADVPASPDAIPSVSRVSGFSGVSSVEVREHVTRPGGARFTAAMLEPELLAARPLVYLCGPAVMMTDLTEQLVACGVPHFDIFTEEFFTDVQVPSTLTPARVRLARSGRELTWTPESGTLLDAAEAAGASLPSGCRTGVCESCLVRVRAGEVAHLSAVETDRDGCLTCQAVPIGDIELDA